MAEPISSFSIPIVGHPWRMVRSPDGRYIYLIGDDSDGIRVIDTQSNSVISVITLDLIASSLAISPDGNRLFLTDSDKDRVTIVDVPMRAVVASILISDMPHVGRKIAAVHPNGRYVYASSGLFDMAVIDLVNNSIVSVIPVKARNAALSLDGRELYLTTYHNSLAVVDTATNNLVADISGGLDSADQLVLAPDGRRLYVTPNFDGWWLTVFDTTSRQVTTHHTLNDPLFLFGIARAVAVSPDGRYVFVCDDDEHVTAAGVAIIETATNKFFTKFRARFPLCLTVVDQTVYVATDDDVQGFYIGYLRTHLDPTLIDRTAEYQTPGAAGPPTGCAIPGTGLEIISYRDTSGHVQQMWRDANGNTGAGDMTYFANAPTAAGDPTSMVNTTRNEFAVLYRSTNGEVRSLYPWNGTTGTDNLSGAAGAPNAAGNPVGYYVPAFDTSHVIYRSGDGHLHELYWIGEDAVSYGGNLTVGVSAPKAAGDPVAFVGSGNRNLVVYRAANNHIMSIYWLDGPSGLDELSASAGTPTAAGDPVAFYTAHNDMHQVIYRGNDNQMYELFWVGQEAVTGSNLTLAAGVTAGGGNPVAYYNPATNTKHAIYRSGDGHLHELWWIPGTSPVNHVDLTQFAGAPLAADRPMAFWVPATKTNHVAYRGQDKHVYEISWVLW